MINLTPIWRDFVDAGVAAGRIPEADRDMLINCEVTAVPGPLWIDPVRIPLHPAEQIPDSGKTVNHVTLRSKSDQADE